MTTGEKTLNQAPVRSLDQRMEALHRANEIRVRRAQLKRDLKTGSQDINVILLSTARSRAHREGVRHAARGAEAGSCAGDALPQPVPDHAVEDGRRTHRAPALRAPGTARPLTGDPAPVGRLIVISGPSGAGKGTLIARLLEQSDDFVVATSATTRRRRAGRGRRPRVLLPRRRGVPAASRPQRVPRARRASPAVATARSGGGRPVARDRARRDPRARGRRRLRRASPPARHVARLHRPSELRGSRAAPARARDRFGRARSRRRLAIAREQLEARDLFDIVIVNDDRDRAARELLGYAWDCPYGRQ